LEPDARLFLTPPMSIMKRIREFFGSRILRAEEEPVRIRTGSNFHSADRVAIIYRDMDETFFKDLRDYAKYLKENFKIKSVYLLAFVDEPEKKIPAWQQHKLELEYFTRNDLNWHLRPVTNADIFVKEDFDILIDFSGGNVVPLNFILKESASRMKVGMRGTRAERYCDLMIDMGNQFGVAKYVEQLNSYLSNPKIR